MSWVALDLGIIKIHWYGIFYVISFLFWYFYLYWILNRYNSKIFKFKIEDNIWQFLTDLLLFVILGVLIWGRLGHVIIYNLSYYLHRLAEIFYIWQWWMSFLGGIIWVVVSIFLFWKKYKLSFEDLVKLWDLIVLPLGFWIMLVRIWNFLNQELYGKIINLQDNWLIFFLLEKLKLVYVYTNIDNYWRINTNFIESFFEGFLFFLIINFIFFKDIKKNCYRPWKYLWIFFMWYAIVRFVVEFLRDYSKNEFIWIFTKTQWFLFWMFIVWLFFFKLFLNKRKESKIFK